MPFRAPTTTFWRISRPQAKARTSHLTLHSSMPPNSVACSTRQEPIISSSSTITISSIKKSLSRPSSTT